MANNIYSDIVYIYVVFNTQQVKTFIQQGCIQLTKSNSKQIYNKILLNIFYNK